MSPLHSSQFLHKKASFLCRLGSVLLVTLASGCSFQAHRPAPVESIYGVKRPAIERGSIRSDTYKVKKGDTLYSIAWGAGKDYAQIAKLNQLDKSYTIYPGQVLILDSKKNVKSNSQPSSSKNSKSKPQKPKDKIYKKQTVKQKQAVAQAKQNKPKKTLDPKPKSAYPVSNGKQNVNHVVHKPSSTLPDKVSRWIWPVNGRVIGAFSAKEQGNKGIKIAGNRGDIIKATADGRVVYAGNALRGYGNLVIIKHSDDYLSAYAHADKILVKEKQHVSAGQTVAKMGSTGTNQVMLHFEIRYHGQSVNPLNYLPKR